MIIYTQDYTTNYLNLVNNRCGTRSLQNVLGEGMGQRGEELQECSLKKEEGKQKNCKISRYEDLIHTWQYLESGQI